MKRLKRLVRNCGAVLAAVALVGTGIWTNGYVPDAGKMKVQAQDNMGQFLAEAEIQDVDRDACTVLVTLENAGLDWEGSVRLTPAREYTASTAYDTTISLPQGSKKQFTVKLTQSDIQNSYSYGDNSLQISLYDKKGKRVANKTIDRFFENSSRSLNMGILSDNYRELTYLDIGGDELYFGGDYYPIKLREVTQDELEEELGDLDFLVIDRFNTGILTQDQLQALQDWNDVGGMLLIGTGSYGKDTLSGLENYLGVKCRAVYSPSAGILTGNEVITDAGVSAGDVSDGDSEDYFDNPYSDDIYNGTLALADLQDVYKQYNTSYFTGNMGLSGSMGDGAVMVLPFSLTELSTVDKMAFDQYGGDLASYSRNLLTDLCNNASIRYSNKYSNVSDGNRVVTRMLKFWGNSNNALNFGLLKVIVFLYVIFVGPILYLILMLVKKKELYWGLVPVTALLGIGLIFLAGRGFRMVDTSVYSVRLENLNDRRTAAYLYCYDADHKEWDLKLADDFEYVGGLDGDNWYGGYTDGDDSVYHCHVQHKGSELRFGVKPDGSFDDSFFFAGYGGKKEASAGKIVCNKVLSGAVSGIYGQITNETGEDFVFHAVILDNNLYVYDELRAGATSDLGTANPIYRSTSTGNMASDFLYSCMDDDDMHWNKTQMGQLAALGTAINYVYPEQTANRPIVIGVTRSGEKVVDDRCYEIAYKCLYSME